MEPSEDTLASESERLLAFTILGPEDTEAPEDMAVEEARRLKTLWEELGMMDPGASHLFYNSLLDLKQRIKVEKTRDVETLFVNLTKFYCSSFYVFNLI